MYNVVITFQIKGSSNTKFDYIEFDSVVITFQTTGSSNTVQMKVILRIVVITFQMKPVCLYFLQLFHISEFLTGL